MHKHVPGWAAAVAAILVAGSAACNRTPENTTSGVDTTAATPAQNTTQTPDWWTTTKVQAKFFADNQVKGRDINVDTKDGVVTLRGAVDTDAERQQALTIARGVDGVKRVEDQLTLKTAGAETPTATTGTTTSAAGPAWITTKIQAQYFADPEVKPWNIDVTTTGNGSVTLQGEVDTTADRQKALQIARNTEGVISVDDQLRVRGENETSGSETAGGAGTAAAPPATKGEPAGGDAWTTAKIQSKYFLDPDVKGHEIDVDTSNGVVTLSGTVDNDMQHRQAVAIARNTDGVTDVTDNLQVQHRAAANTTPANPAASSDTAVQPVSMPDPWITTKIQSQYLHRRGGQVAGRQRGHERRGGDADRNGRDAGGSQGRRGHREADERRQARGEQHQSRRARQVGLREGSGLRAQGSGRAQGSRVREPGTARAAPGCGATV